MRAEEQLVGENVKLRGELASAQRPNRQRIMIGLLIVFVIVAFGTAIIMFQAQIAHSYHMVIANQISARASRNNQEGQDEQILKNQVLIAKHDHIKGVKLGPKPVFAPPPQQ